MLHDQIESEKLPGRLVLVTPEVTAGELKAWSHDYDLPHALWAYDPRNRNNISLNNILQTWMVKPDGTCSYMPANQAKAALASGTYRYPVEGLTDAKVKDLWWAVERGEPGALKALIAAAARKGPAQAELTKVLDAVKAATAKRQDELVVAAPTMASLEGLEQLIGDSDGLDTKAAAARLKELRAAKDLKDELKARDIYQQCEQQMLSPKPDLQKAAKANLAQLAAKMPDTEYGKKAAAASK